METPQLPIRPTNLTCQEAIDIIGRYFPQEWKSLRVKDVSVDRLQTGFNNQVYVVSNEITVKEPRKLVIRKYGGNFVQDKSDLKPLTTDEELILVCELSRKCLSPRLYGFFEGGRVEEFIDSHQMTTEESKSHDLQADLAKNFARFHAVEAPLPKPGYNMREVIVNIYGKAKPVMISCLQDYIVESVHYIFRVDWEKELEWFLPLVDLDRHRMVLMHWDLHLQNIGVRNQKSDNDGGLRTILYDYELASYNMRGKDMGLFFMSVIGVFGGKELMSKDDIACPPVDFFQHFLREYVKECKGLGFDDWDEEGRDSYHHIMLESLVGGMVSALLFLFAFTTGIPFVGERRLQALNTMERLHTGYFVFKNWLITSFPNYETDL